MTMTMMPMIPRGQLDAFQAKIRGGFRPTDHRAWAAPVVVVVGLLGGVGDDEERGALEEHDLIGVRGLGELAQALLQHFHLGDEGVDDGRPGGGGDSQRENNAGTT